MKAIEFCIDENGSGKCPNGCGQSIFLLEATLPTDLKRAKVTAQCITCMEHFLVGYCCPTNVDPICSFFTGE